MNRVAVLTPLGTGAIATVAVAGPGAWEAVRSRFRPSGRKPLDNSPRPGRFWFGTLGDQLADEVVVAVPPSGERVEVHCHGGRQVVRWLVGLFTGEGFLEVSGWELAELSPGRDRRALEPLGLAPTFRTASILMDQYHGAFRRTVTELLSRLDTDDSPVAELDRLDRLADLGEHLTVPWKVVVAGPPNVGKSSLINALAGYQRAVVSPEAGTTRDAVSTIVAFDGWPVELTDSAGIRQSSDPLETEGIESARRSLLGADLIVWVFDGSAATSQFPDVDLPSAPVLVVNKVDRPAGWDWATALADALRVSAVTGEGVPDLAKRIAREVVPHNPEPGEGVPFLTGLASAIRSARAALATGDRSRCRAALAGCIAPDG